jgi:hypothetical protein
MTIVTLPAACFLAARHFRRIARSGAVDAIPLARVAEATAH